MTRCDKCKRRFPDGLVQPMFGTISALLCGVCALEVRNEMLGLPVDTPFNGEMAQEIYEQTREYIAEKNPQ